MIVAVSGMIVEFPQDVIERLARKFSPEKIILFGSRARGTANEGSDFDLLCSSMRSRIRPCGQRNCMPHWVTSLMPPTSSSRRPGDSNGTGMF